MDRSQDGNGRLTAKARLLIRCCGCRRDRKPPPTGILQTDVAARATCPNAEKLVTGAAMLLQRRQAACATACPAVSVLNILDKNRRDIGNYQSIWTDFKMETAGSPLDTKRPEGESNDTWRPM
eukprot:COSAG01_NODE_1612_length_9735_cov_74.461810_7_plen_123_part_00